MNGKQLIFVISVGVVLMFIIAGGILLLARDDGRDRERLQVVTTFYPLYYLASQIGGESASVSMLIPENVEPHAWEPKVSDILNVDRADVFIYNGGGFEPWVEDFLGSSRNSDLRIVDTSIGIMSNYSEEHGGPSEEHEEETSHHHEDGDPHFWLDPVLAMVQVDNIAKGLSEADPEQAVEYARNAVSLKDRLNKLDSDFEGALKDRKKNDIITTHEGFNYLADRYGFDTHAAVGTSGDEQPSVQDIVDLIRTLGDLDLRYVFVEPVYSDQYMETVSDETGAELLILDGLHGRMGVHSDLDYFEIMYENLRNLRIGLEAE